MFFQKSDIDFIVFDLETSGLNIHTCEILEIGALKIKKDKVVDRFHSLVKPTLPVDDSALSVNHLNVQDLFIAPSANKIIPKFMKFIGNSKLVGYNIRAFDIPILNRYAQKYGFSLSNDTEDVLYIVPHKIKDLPNRKLTTVASYFQIDTTGAHNALRDSEITHECYSMLKSLPDIKISSHTSARKKFYHPQNNQHTILLNELKAMLLGILSDNTIDDNEVEKLNVWLNCHKDLLGEYPYDQIYTIVQSTLADGVIDSTEREKLNSIFTDISSHDMCDHCISIEIPEHAFVLTGEFEYGSKENVQKYIESNGGICKSTVSSKVHYVVMGNLGSPDWSFGNYGNKVKKAKELQANGKAISIISENELFK